MGDIRIQKDDIAGSDKSVGRTGGRWPNNTVYYDIDTRLPNQNRVTTAIAHWEANTALRFIQRTNQRDYIYFTDLGSCSSHVGRIGGRQTISIASGCRTGETIHEIGHAVGLWHEQSRVDRDQYITINFQNILPGFEHNFQTYAAQGQDGNEFTPALDFNSIMMYGPFAFSVSNNNDRPTIVRRNGSIYNTQRINLSAGDIEGINRMYPPIVGDNICDGVALYDQNQNYQVGDRVVFQGSLYELEPSRWSFIGRCEP